MPFQNRRNHDGMGMGHGCSGNGMRLSMNVSRKWVWMFREGDAIEHGHKPCMTIWDPDATRTDVNVLQAWMNWMWLILVWTWIEEWDALEHECTYCVGMDVLGMGCM